MVLRSASNFLYKARQLVRGTYDGKVRRLILCLAVLHVALAIGVFAAGRLQIVPAYIDRDGIMASFAFDSYDYQQRAAKLADTLQQGRLISWTTASQPLHLKFLSLTFAVLNPLFGYSPLSAEPFNLVCYLSVVVLMFALGREVAGRRAGFVAAAIVSLWPSFLLHSLQLLKDPLFIAATIALILCVVTLLTRTFTWRSATVVAGISLIATVMLSLIRFNFAALLVALFLLVLLLVLIRQLLERRLLLPNLLSPLPAILIVGVFIAFHTSHASERFKLYQSDHGGPPKAVSTALKFPSIVSSLPHLPKTAVTSTLAPVTDEAARRVSTVRSRFAASYPEAGSALDPTVRFSNLRELVSYLPRGFEVGMWAPFPNSWISTGRRVGNAGKSLAGIETLSMYLCQLLALFAIVRSPRELAPWLLFVIAILGMTMLGLVVPNVGALYRFRYPFWFLLIILGVKSLQVRANSRTTLGSRAAAN